MAALGRDLEVAGAGGQDVGGQAFRLPDAVLVEDGPAAGVAFEGVARSTSGPKAAWPITIRPRRARASAAVFGCLDSSSSGTSGAPEAPGAVGAGVLPVPGEADGVWLAAPFAASAPASAPPPPPEQPASTNNPATTQPRARSPKPGLSLM